LIADFGSRLSHCGLWGEADHALPEDSAIRGEPRRKLPAARWRPAGLLIVSLIACPYTGG
jgi:hypothetical protein